MRAACGRDDAVHPQVLDHLAVVILRMKGADHGNGQARGKEWVYRLGQQHDLVFRGDPGNGPMAECEGVFQVLDNFGLALQLCGAVGIFFKGLGVKLAAYKRGRFRLLTVDGKPLPKSLRMCRYIRFPA